MDRNWDLHALYKEPSHLISAAYRGLSMCGKAGLPSEFQDAGASTLGHVVRKFLLTIHSSA